MYDHNRYHSSVSTFFMDLASQLGRWYPVSALFLPLCHFEEVMKGNTLTFTEDGMKTFVTHSVLSVVYLHLERPSSAELIILHMRRYLDVRR